MTILLSGGHLTPALALIEHLKKNSSNDRVVYVGRTYSQQKLKQLSPEQTEVEKLGVQFLSLDSGKINFYSLLTVPFEIIKTVSAFFRALKIFQTEKPDVFIAFGGYLGVPLGFAAWLKHIPVLLHEQTVAPGFANRLLATIATKIAITHQSSLTFFPKEKTMLTGNLVRQSLWSKQNTPPEWFLTKEAKPLLYITGGSQGSHSLNMTVKEILPELLNSWTVIHQTGKPGEKQNDLAELTLYKSQLSKDLQTSYFVREWITESELAWIYQHAAATISRAGANTVQEIILANIPALFIPLPFTHHDEQRQNAELVALNGGGVVLVQEKLTPELLLKSLDQLRSNAATFQTNLKKLADKLPKNPLADFYQMIQDSVQVKTHA